MPITTKASQTVVGKKCTIKNDLVARFLRHVQAVPNKVAVMTTEKSVTYRELYVEVIHWKNLLSPYKGKIIIICVERSPQLLAQLLAMQWLDIAYIPLDVSTPFERLNDILTDSHAAAILYNGDSHPTFSDLACNLLNIAVLPSSSPLVSQKIEPYTAKQSGIAYIIYTSGSTGKPKGVIIYRKGLHNLLNYMSQYYLLHNEELVLAMNTISFDISVLEIYCPIWQQKTLFMIKQEQEKDPLSLEVILNTYPITCIHATPSFWVMLLNLEWQSHPNLVAMCGGESLSQALAQRLLAKASAVWNMYGPTESTVLCSLKQILPNSPITIGRPIANTEMRIMDSRQRILPHYIKGDLYIGGIGLAEGYVNNSELTADKFISAPDALNGRLYKTGDLACSTPEGEFLIFGRSDNQVKLHGYRIELEEIEAKIQTFPGINEAAVAVYHEQLVAYLCCENQTHFSKTDFIQYLSQTLPNYMLPEHIILLNHLPKTLGVKIDRKALPAPTILHTNTEIVHLTPLQLALIRIWSEELAIENITIQDNFFELGGHSLLAARIITKVAQQLGKQTHFQDFHHAPTIERFAKILEQAPPVEKSPVLLPAHLADAHSLPLEDHQLVYWLGKFYRPHYRKSNIVHRQRIQGVVNKIALDLALQLVLQKQEIFSYHIHHLYPKQTLCTKPSFRLKKWSETSLTHLSQTEAEIYLSERLNELFFKKTWQVKTAWLTADLYYLKNDHIELQICMPHLISDEQSGGIFFKELSQAYLYFTQQIPLQTNHELQSYKNYIIRQNTLSHNHSHENAVFWKQYLKDTSLFEFPKKYILKETQAKAMHFPIPESFILKLKKLCIDHHLGPNDLLSAAVTLTLLECCFKKPQKNTPKNLLIGIVKGTRDDAHYDDVIGLFVRTELLKLSLQDNDQLISLAKNAQQSNIETSHYQTAPYLVKLASVGKLLRVKKPIKKMLFQTLSKLFIQFFSVNPSLVEALSILATTDMKNQFFITINMLHNFLDHQNKSESLLGLPKKEIPSFSMPAQIINTRFELTFHRNDGQNKPYVTILTNLSPKFQKEFQAKFISMIEKAVILKNQNEPVIS